jgi:hypothetical protein
VFLVKGRQRLLVAALLAALLVGCTAPRPSLVLGDAIIDGAASWSGEVRIKGVVTVKKEGRLTILPGTRVVFERFDRDGDGIGDGELLVEGEIVARGTAQAPILFTSGAGQPQKADWKYLYLDFARRGELEHVIAEYAYSGIQVHFCQARVRHSEFRHNVDGVRFSTVNIEVAGNRIHDNTHGLRYEERRSTAQVHHNDITGNDIGIFVVTRSDDRAVVEQNNIAGNRLYNVKLGLEQAGGVTFPRNWWGSTDPGEIAATFFDGRRDPALGRVAAAEPLPAPVSVAAWQAQQGESR